MSRKSRIRREKRTVRAMVTMYCARHHARDDGLCPECQKLLSYSEDKVDKCVFRKSNPTCLKCPVHCFDSAMRERMRAIMRYAGPRMMPRHPILTAGHIVDGLRRPRK